MRKLTKEEQRVLISCLFNKKHSNKEEIEFMKKVDDHLESSSASESIQKRKEEENTLIDQLMDRLAYVAIDEAAYLRHKK
ncbi:hypothetical protein [Risungbinella massiliensis]|uniref:hypothetical protein n=1 Tax=Risungbinella massiliensis TaxID=1329796 RepID=UPI0005CC81DE|nr:hypothetical protein [Risungbinella massiliensis]